MQIQKPVKNILRFKNLIIPALFVVLILLCRVDHNVWIKIWDGILTPTPTTTRLFAVAGIAIAVLVHFLTQYWKIRDLRRNSLQIRLQNRIEYQKLIFEINKLQISLPMLRAMYDDHQDLIANENPQRRLDLLKIDAYASYHVNMFEVVIVFFETNKEILSDEEAAVYTAWLNWLRDIFSKSEAVRSKIHSYVELGVHNDWFISHIRRLDEYQEYRSRMVYSKLFPSLVGKKWSRISLDEMAKKDYPGRSRQREDNPLNDPLRCKKWVDECHKKAGVDFSFGGYLENRSHLWRGHYQEKFKRFIHLGIDYNVPVGTEVVSLGLCEVIASWADPDQGGGWGGRVITRLAKSGVHLIYAHLDPDNLPPQGAVIKAGERLGTIGDVNVNGGWYPHLHLQCVIGEVSKDLDGYASSSKKYKAICPDPENWEFIAASHAT